MRFTIAAFAGLLLAQEPIRVTSRLVEVNVIVRDSKGAIDGLTADSFKLFDNGKPQRISVFKISRSETAAEPSQPSKTFSNRTASGEDRLRSATVFLIDALNTDFAGQVMIKRNLEKLFNSFDPQRKLDQPRCT